jgi:23S rRNA (adenine2030-N6)-methyltransferase
MLSYRHAYHAGNHADVLKHLILVLSARYMASKDKPFWIVDTHAGAGAYSLESEHARKLGEHAEGISRIWQAPNPPEAVADYLSLVKQFNPGEKLRQYPGSPWIASKLLRPEDRLRLFELHSVDARQLKKLFKDGGRQIMASDGDGLAGLKAVLPPPSRRGMVLIDPSYEDKKDYSLVPQALTEAMKRFADGTYAVWYPQLAKPEPRQFPDRLKKAAGAADWLHVTLTTRRPPDNGIGMYGSGMFLINPPWTLADQLKACLPWIAEKLSLESSGDHPPATFRIESSSDVGAAKARPTQAAPLTRQQPIERKRPNRRPNQP